MATSPPPSPYDYLTYTRCLNAWFDWRKTHYPRTSSARWVAKRCGLSSGALSNILNGNRHPSPQTVAALGQVTDWSADQVQFFGLMVTMERSGNEESRRRAVDAVYARRAQRDQRSEQRLNVATEWAELFVRELVLLPGFQADGAWMSNKLGGRLSAEAAERVLDQLVVSGLVEQHDDDSWSAPAQAHAESVHRGGRSIHVDLLDLASNTVTNADSDDMAFISVTLSAPYSAFENLKRDVFRTVQRIAHELDAAEDEPEELVQLQVQLYRMEAKNGEDPDES